MQPEHKPSPPSGMAGPQFQRPASQATSVKAEPGSAMGSIASASVANKVRMSLNTNEVYNQRCIDWLMAY